MWICDNNRKQRSQTKTNTNSSNTNYNKNIDQTNRYERIPRGNDIYYNFRTQDLKNKKKNSIY